MTRALVWAPDCGEVALVAGGERQALERGPRGWWSAAAGLVRHGVDYAFSLDGGEPLPDPRAPWLPHGVHGPGRWLDHGTFRWSDAAWRAAPLSRALFYELHVGTFSQEGTFDGAHQHLEHLRGLGVTHVELMPVASFPGRFGWGYDGVGLFAPHEPYGGPEGLKRLVDACHRAGLAVVLDVVYNHLGPEGNHLARFGPYFTERHGTPWGPAVNLDGRGSDEVRRFLCDNALAWLRDYHFDGLRLDAVHGLHDSSALPFLEQLARETRRLERELGRPLVLIAESDLNDPRLLAPPEAGGHGLDALWSDDFHHALHVALTGERTGYYADFTGLADLAKALQRVYVHDGTYSPHRGRRHGRPIGDLGGERFLGYLQNHDQVGNRAVGDRIGHRIGPEPQKIGAALVLAAPFVPLLFQGEEWGASAPFQYFADLQDPELARAVREGRKREFASFGWQEELPDPMSEGTFERCKLGWGELTREPHASLFAWYRDLARLRASRPGLQDGRLVDVRVAWDERARWLRLDRGGVSVAVHLGAGPMAVPLPDRRAWEIALASSPAELREGEVMLHGEAVAILEEVHAREPRGTGAAARPR